MALRARLCSAKTNKTSGVRPWQSEIWFTLPMIGLVLCRQSHLQFRIPRIAGLGKSCVVDTRDRLARFVHYYSGSADFDLSIVLASTLESKA